jgi:hypothetical protein
VVVPQIAEQGAGRGREWLVDNDLALLRASLVDFDAAAELDMRPRPSRDKN